MKIVEFDKTRMSLCWTDLSYLGDTDAKYEIFENIFTELDSSVINIEIDRHKFINSIHLINTSSKEK